MATRSAREFIRRPAALICCLLVTVAVLGFHTHARASHLRYGHLKWEPRADISPTTAEFTLINGFRRDEFSGSGTDGLPITGDVIVELVGGTSLRFGDGTQTPVLKYEVTAFSVTDNWILGVALEPGAPGPPSGTTIVETESNDGPVDADPIAIGDDYTGDIVPADLDWISFAAGGGESLVATLVLGTLSVGNIAVVDTDGTTPLAVAVRTSPSGDLETRFDLPNAAGTYYLVVQDPFLGPPGTYAVQLRALQETGMPTVLHTYAAQDDAGSPWKPFVFVCCRTFLEQNNAGVFFQLETLVELGSGNRSPASTFLPVTPCPVNAICNFFVPGVDNNPNTTLEWRLSTPIESGGNSVFAQPPGLTVDGATGLVTWDTTGTTVGQLWSCQVTIEDRDSTTTGLRTKVPVDFHIRIVDDTGSPPQCDIPPTPTGVFSVEAGQSFAATVQGSDADPGDLLALNSAGLPPGASTSPLLPQSSASPVSTSLSWTPTADDVGIHPFLFTVADPVGLEAQCFFAIEVSEPAECDVRIDFDDLVHDDALEINHWSTTSPRIVGDGGFNISASFAVTWLATYGTQHDSYSGSTALHGFHMPGSAANFDPLALTIGPGVAGFPQISTDTFSPISAVVTERDSSFPAGTQFEFTGRFPDNSPVMQNVPFDGDIATNHEVLFSGFHGVKYIEWPGTHQIDSICIRAACSDGLDNDGDGLIDLADPSCTQEGDLDERSLIQPDPVPALPTPAMLLLLALLSISGIWTARRLGTSVAPG